MTEKFSIKNFNPKPQFSELVVSYNFDDCSHQVFNLIVELRCGEDIINDQDSSNGEIITISLKKGFVELELDGCEILPGSRYAELGKACVVNFKVVKKSEDFLSTKRSGSIDAAMGINLMSLFTSKASLSGVDKAKKLSKSLESRFKESIDSVRRVTALGGNSWEIVEPENDGILKGLYLGDKNIHKHLCNIRVTRKKFKIISYFKCLPKDISIQTHHTGALSYIKEKFGINRTRVLNILISKWFEKKCDYLILSTSTMRSKYRGAKR